MQHLPGQTRGVHLVRLLKVLCALSRQVRNPTQLDHQVGQNGDPQQDGLLQKTCQTLARNTRE
jgi:hypothetical protein